MLLIHLILKPKYQTAADNNNGNIARRVDVKITCPLKYLDNFSRSGNAFN